MLRQGRVCYFLFVPVQIKDEGLVNDDNEEEEEAPQQLQNEESITGKIQLI